MEKREFYYVLEIGTRYNTKNEIARLQNKQDAVNYAKISQKMHPGLRFRVVKITETIVFSTETTKSTKPTESTE